MAWTEFQLHYFSTATMTGYAFSQVRNMLWVVHSHLEYSSLYAPLSPMHYPLPNCSYIMHECCWMHFLEHGRIQWNTSALHTLMPGAILPDCYMLKKKKKGLLAGRFHYHTTIIFCKGIITFRATHPCVCIYACKRVNKLVTRFSY